MGLEDFAHLIQLIVDFDQSVVNLPSVDCLRDFLGSQLARTSIRPSVKQRILELFSVGRGISDVEYVSKLKG